MSWLSGRWFCFVALLVQFSAAQTTAVPDQSTILAKLKQNGACCTALDYYLPGKVHFNVLTDTGYQSSQLSYYSAQEQSLHPTCIVVPTETRDVSIAVTILSIGYSASIQGCQFAVRSAGHTPQAGAANIDGGVTIDLQSMNSVVVSGDQKTVSIGPGNRWGNIYPKLDALNLAMVGGRVSPVGAGGLITGGGLSFFSGRYGLSCDNIQKYEVVLANGSIITASSSSNPNLYRALKGGSNNFGVVTNFVTKLYPQKEFWGGSIIQPITDKDGVFDFVSNFTSSKTYDPYSALITNFAWTTELNIIVHDVEYTNGDVSWPPPAFAPLDAMPKLSSTVRKAKLTNFTDEIASMSAITNGHNNIFSTFTIINKADVTPEFLAEAYDLVAATYQELVTVVGLVYTMTFQPLPYLIYSKAAASGGNVLGLDRFKDDFVNLFFEQSWTLPTDNARVEAAIQTLEQKLIAAAKSKGLYNEFIYLNYAAKWQDPIKGYGDANVQFLKSVSKQYDPAGIFQKGVPGGFKLGI